MNYEPEQIIAEAPPSKRYVRGKRHPGEKWHYYKILNEDGSYVENLVEVLNDLTETGIKDLDLSGKDLVALPPSDFLTEFDAINLSDNPRLQFSERNVVAELMANFGTHFNLRNTPFETTDFSNDITNVEDYVKRFQALRKVYRKLNLKGFEWLEMCGNVDTTKEEFAAYLIGVQYLTPDEAEILLSSKEITVRSLCKTIASEYSRSRDTSRCNYVDAELAELQGVLIIEDQYKNEMYCFSPEEIITYTPRNKNVMFNPYTRTYVSEYDQQRIAEFMNNFSTNKVLYNPSTPINYLTRTTFFKKLHEQGKMTTIVIDLDHTLINSAMFFPPSNTSNPHFTIMNGQVFTYIRPYAIEFLRYVNSVAYEVIIWSAGTKGYVEEIRDNLCKISGIHKIAAISRNLFNTSIKDVLHLYDKYKYDIDLANVLFIDDIPENVRGVPRNRIWSIKKFFLHDSNDTELMIPE
jgi:hypothetical protein